MELYTSNTGSLVWGVGRVHSGWELDALGASAIADIVIPRDWV